MNNFNEIVDFSKECLCPNSKEICFVEDEKQKKIYTIYKISDKVYLGIVSSHFDVKLSGKLVEKVSIFILNYEIFKITSNLY